MTVTFGGFEGGSVERGLPAALAALRRTEFFEELAKQDNQSAKNTTLAARYNGHPSTNLSRARPLALLPQESFDSTQSTPRDSRPRARFPVEQAKTSSIPEINAPECARASVPHARVSWVRSTSCNGAPSLRLLKYKGTPSNRSLLTVRID